MNRIWLLQVLCVALAGVTVLFIILDKGTWIFITAALCCTIAAQIARERRNAP